MRLKLNKKARQAGMTLIEVMICFVVMGLVIGGMLTAYTNSSNFAEHAGYQLAAESLAVQQLERARAALWDTQSIPPIDNASNLPSVTTNLLDLPITGTNAIFATNLLTTSNITVGSYGNTALIKVISVTTTWPWNGHVMSNTIMTYRSPDQ